jgi:hypothetical protein
VIGPIRALGANLCRRCRLVVLVRVGLGLGPMDLAVVVLRRGIDGVQPEADDPVFTTLWRVPAGTSTSRSGPTAVRSPSMTAAPSP